MKTTTQIFIDKQVIRPITYILNFLVRITGQILRIDHRLDRPFERIAICKFKGMGSIIQATPLLMALRKRYPTAEIIFVSTRPNQSILSQISVIDTLVLLDDRSAWQLICSIVKSLITLIKRRPDVYIDLEIYADFSTLFTVCTLSKNRLGF